MVAVLAAAVVVVAGASTLVAIVADAALSAVKELTRFTQAEMVWCQEEPKNQGSWNFMEPNLEWVLGRIKATHGRPVFAGRSASASPATGLASQHKTQQEALINQALTIEGN